MQVEVRRNVYDEKGKELKAKEETNKQANGETNGAGSGEAATKAMDEAGKEPKKIFNCYSCGVDCTRSRFHYAKSDPASASNKPDEIKYDLCPNCYFQSRMPSSHRSSDFVKMDDPTYSSIPDKDAPWTDSETLLLLEGLEQFDNEWSEISKHVGTRTREECVMKFLQLDIQDPYMEENKAIGASSLRAMGGREPISQMENPVMSVVSFLAQLADPKVVAAASQRSTEQMQKEIRAKLEKGIGANSSTETQKDSEGKTETNDADTMDVDTVPDKDSAEPTAENDIATIGLATAASRSSALASMEERELTRLVGAAVNLTLQKFELKLAQFQEMEEIVQAERRDLEKGRQQLFLDRLAFKKRVKDMELAFRHASLKSPEEGMKLMRDAVGMEAGGKGYAFGGPVNGMGAGEVQQPSMEGGEGFKRVEV